MTVCTSCGCQRNRAYGRKGHGILSSRRARSRGPHEAGPRRQRRGGPYHASESLGNPFDLRQPAGLHRIHPRRIVTQIPDGILFVPRIHQSQQSIAHQFGKDFCFVISKNGSGLKHMPGFMGQHLQMAGDGEPITNHHGGTFEKPCRPKQSVWTHAHLHSDVGHITSAEIDRTLLS